jgi:plasmid stability protein
LELTSDASKNNITHQMRTTVDRADPILRELKRRQAREGKSLGELISELLAQALRADRVPEPTASGFDWTSKPMRALVELEDKETIHRILDER